MSGTVNVPFADKLGTIHPILTVSEAKFFFCDKVTKVSHRMNYLLISNAGIFVLRKRSFPSGYHSKLIIPWQLLNKIEYKKNVLGLHGNGGKIELIVNEDSPIITICYTLRVALFGQKDFEASEDIQEMRSQFEYDPESEIVDRFISLCAENSSLKTSDHFTDLIRKLLEFDGTLTVTPDLAASPRIREFLQAIARGPSLTAINLDRISFISFGELLTESILNISETVETLKFSSLSFNGAYTDFGRLFGRYLKAPLKHLSFKECDLNNNGFDLFLTDLSKYKGAIETLSFSQCKMNTQALIKSIIESPSLHKISKFSLNGSPIDQVQLMQWHMSDWFLTGRNLKELELYNTEMDVGSVIQSCCQYDCGVNMLSFSGDAFSKPLTTRIKSFQSIKYLNLSKTKFNCDSLSSLFQNIADADVQPASLILDNIEISSDDLGKFYSVASKYAIESMETFSWAGNAVQISQVMNFLAFLEKQKNLSDLTLSYVFNVNTPDLVRYLSSLFKKMRLERLVMKGQGTSAFPESFTEILEVLLESKTLMGIDIVGQKIGNSGLSIISQLINTGTLVAVSFEGTNATDISIMEEVLNAMVSKSSIEFADWPEFDVRQLLSKVPLGSKPATTQRFRDLKAAFNRKFRKGTTDAESQPRTELKSLTLLRTASQCTVTPPKRSLVSNVNNISSLSVKGVDVGQLLVECIGVEALKPTSDPLVKSYTNIEESIKFEF